MGLMSALLGGSPTTTTTTEPWKPQGQALQFAFNEAQNLYNSKKGTPFYTGALHAGLDPLTNQGIDRTAGYTTGAGQQGADSVAGASGNLLGANGDYLGAIRGLYGAASGDPTQGNLDAAGRYANNPYLDRQIDAVGADIRRNLGENIMPSIDRAATASGNINSSRAGIAEGIAARGANEELAQTAAGMRSNAWNNGLSMAENARTANMNAMQGAAGLYGGAVGQGIAGAGQGQTMNLQLLDSLVSSGQIRQEDAQHLMDTEFARWQGQDTRDQDLLKNYYGIIGANNWGGTQTQKTTGGGPGILGGILGGLSTLKGLGGIKGIGKLF
jgi:hypothetical protein